ncbi:MAG: gliding motility-associated C-terminal domain-containing protein [Cyclobacteriaceae bacterium]|nr:gliding motility-associated C-terminal domain-containing protein [Cyclobacteriaceae bacterium]
MARINSFIFLFFISIEAWCGPGNGFIENKNQWPCGVDFLASIPGGQMAVQAGNFNYFFLDYQKVEELHESTHSGFKEVSTTPDNVQIKGRKVSVNFLNSNSVKAKASKPHSNYYNYFFGSNPDQWASRVYAYEELGYEGIYEGIDLKLYSKGSNIKYDLVVAAGVDPNQIQIKYDGALAMSLLKGDLIIDAELAEIIEMKPIAYQVIEGEKRYLKAAYMLEGNVVSFSFPEGYDNCYELVIDPLLIFSTYSGSQADNWGSTATPGEKGNMYSSGVTNHFVGPTFSGTFPATPGAFQTNYGGIYDIAILKYDSAGQNLLYATYLGGSDSESPHSLVINENEELLVLGTTSSSNFPTTPSAYDRTYNDTGGLAINHVVTYSNGSDLFVAKISKDGSQLLASTFLGGSTPDGLSPSLGALAINYGDQLRGDIISDSNGNIYVSTVTSSADFPMVAGFDLTYRGGSTDALVLKLNPDLSQILWSSFLGGSSEDAAYTIKLDSEDKLWVAGGTASADFATTIGVYKITYGGNVDGWIANIANDGSALMAATFVGTGSYDQVYFLDLNENDDVYVYGQTAGNIPVSSGVYSNPNSGQFLQKFSKDLTTLNLSTVFGSGRGAPDISPTAFLVNECNNIYMTGWGGAINRNINIPLMLGSSTIGMPTTADAFQSTTSGSDFYFIVLTDDASEFLYGTFLGGAQSKTHVDGGTSRFDKGGIVYHAVCSGCVSGNPTGHPTSDFPTTPNVWSSSNNSLNCNNAAFKFDLSSLRARIVTNSIALDQPGLNKVCLPDKLVFQNRSTGGQFYEWDFGDGTVDFKPDTAAIIHEYKNAGTYSIKLRAVDQGTCIGEDFDFATVVVSKAMGFVGEDQTICHGTDVQLLAGGGVQYAWNTTEEGVVSKAAQPVFSPADTMTYYISITDVNNCVVKDTVEVRVVPRINLQFEIEKVTDCASRTALKLVNTTKEEEEQFFEFGDGNSSNQREVVYNYASDGNYHVKLVGKRAFCVFEESVDLPFFTIRVPNVITPGNSDANSLGKNDTFKILYGEDVNSPTTTEAGLSVHLSVYNRWGKLAYENNNYDDSWSGEGLQAGTYYYEVKIINEPLCKGWIQIIR